MYNNSCALGAQWNTDNTVFGVFAPYANNVTVKVYGTDATTLVNSCSMTKGEDGIWSATVNGNLDGCYYLYDIDGLTTVDPYAKSFNANTQKGMILDLSRTNPEGWGKDRFDAKPAIIWEVHVRDFSSDEYLELPYHGKYANFVSGVKTPNGKTALVDYLAELGVTYVHLLPIMDFACTNELDCKQYNWGYDPVSYFAPEGSYATDAQDGAVRIRELKQLVQNLHKAGIGVILDVVYNHTYTAEGNALNNCAPDYYYRHDKDGNLTNGSGCGNDTASEQPMFRKLMIDSVTYWTKEYHIDGFRFDLMGLHDVDTMNAIREALDNLYPDGRGKDVIIYGEPWYCKEPTEIVSANIRNVKKLNDRIAIFNSTTRDGIRGRHFGGLRKGFVEGKLSSLENALCGIAGGTVGSKKDKDGFEINVPSQQVLYCACHDDYTLFDHISAVTDKDFDVRRAQHMAGFMLMSGIGMVFMQAGEEFLRTKYMDGNSYRSPDSINKLDWKRREDNDDTVSYYKGLIAVRKSNSVFDNLTDKSVVDNFRLVPSKKGSAVYTVGNILYCVNNTEYGLNVKFDGTGVLLADIERADVNGLGELHGGLRVAPHSVAAVRLTDNNVSSVTYVTRNIKHY